MCENLSFNVTWVLSIRGRKNSRWKSSSAEFALFLQTQTVYLFFSDAPLASSSPHQASLASVLELNPWSWNSWQNHVTALISSLTVLTDALGFCGIWLTLFIWNTLYHTMVLTTKDNLCIFWQMLSAVETISASCFSVVYSFKAVNAFTIYILVLGKDSNF